MYRNYDGARSSFGDLSVSASGPNPDVVSSFAALRSSDNALTIMVVSKALSGNTPVTVNLAGFAAGSAAQAWQLDAGNTIRRLADVPVSGSSFSQGVPAQSITLYVVPAGGGKIRKPRRRPGDMLSAGTAVSAPESVQRPQSAPAQLR